MQRNAVMQRCLQDNEMNVSTQKYAIYYKAQ